MSRGTVYLGKAVDAGSRTKRREFIAASSASTKLFLMLVLERLERAKNQYVDANLYKVGKMRRPVNLKGPPKTEIHLCANVLSIDPYLRGTLVSRRNLDFVYELGF